nr:unnamed protein product [Digitaria exilis]
MAAAVLVALVIGAFPATNITTNYYNIQWLSARATWYGRPTGAGPDDNGGACGIKDVNLPPYAGMTSCGNLPLFKDGKGCGSCYQIKCMAPECSGQPVVVFITDMNYMALGTAFGSMARPGLDEHLRHRGIIDLHFRRVPCKYGVGQKIVFHVEAVSNPFYLAVLVKFVAMDGNIVQMELKEMAWPWWQPMRHSSDMSRPLRGPLSIRLTSESGRKLVATDVIPANWQPNTVYYSNIQF